MSEFDVVEPITHFVCAEVLHCVDIDDLELVTRDEGINPLQGRLEIPKESKRSTIRTAPFTGGYVLVRPSGDKPIRTSTPVRTPGVSAAFSQRLSQGFKFSPEVATYVV